MLVLQRLLTTAAVLVATVGASAQKQTLFDFGWEFEQNGKTINVDLPHDWDIYAGPDAASGATKEGGGWYPGGKGEYRKTFKTPVGELVRLHFEGVYQQAQVFVNGLQAGHHTYGYTPFTVDMTPFLYHDEEEDNEVVVKVNNAVQPNCRWYSGSGIYRHVWLQTMPFVHIEENGIMVSTSDISDSQATVMVTVAVVNEADSVRRIDNVEVAFEGGIFKSAQQEGAGQDARELKPGEKATFTRKYVISKPRLWSLDDPYRYQATVRLKEQGKTADRRTVRFGIRSISFDTTGFRLNGKPLLINGACVHHDDGVLGAMAFDAAEVRKVSLMKQAGFNLIRTSHNPSTTAFLNACDSLGMLVIDEAFDGWRSSKTTYDYHLVFDSCCRSDIHSMVLRDRLHPSVISWSIGNEVIERKDLRVVTTARQLKRYVREVDDQQRPVTEALCAWDSDWEIYDPHAEVLDVVGYNYMMHKHESDHQRDPSRVMWQTESYPRDAFVNWSRTSDYPYIVGDIVWTGLDYLGESGIGRYYYEGETEGEHYRQGGQPEWHGAYCGDVDITGWRKPISHYRDMLWNDIRKPYIAVKEPDGYHGRIKETQWSVWPTWESWNWNGWEGKPIEVEVYTKDPSVALYCNGKLMDTKQVSRDTEYKAVFRIDYQPGELKAVTNSGNAILATADRPARLRLTPDRTVIAADGQDLSFITVEVVDKQGRVVPDAALPCAVSVSGCGQLMAAASADMKDFEPSVSTQVTTWKGRALIVVRSARQTGSAKVAVRSSLPTATTTIKIK
ncbi:MAG: DUF4982 domain-containing protein [Prevotella sp.]|nr:DUF4982 domain-containing protein [Prevotella sp.]